MDIPSQQMISRFGCGGMGWEVEGAVGAAMMDAPALRKYIQKTIGQEVYVAR